jgi:broad specificity polyphosphatase/5'/3'-nucleotidase SurE
MRRFFTNDDGVHAQGRPAFESIAWSLSNDLAPNVNFPTATEKLVGQGEATGQGSRDVRIRHAEQGAYLQRRDDHALVGRDETFRPSGGADLVAGLEGRISVTPLHTDLTHKVALRFLVDRMERVDYANLGSSGREA